MKPLKVLIACEYSGTVRDAFIAKGHHAVSCDLLPTEKPGPHYLGSVLDILHRGWDMMIAHPPCTHLSKAGAWCWKHKANEQAEAYQFVLQLWSSGIPMIALENPVGWLNTNWMRPTQIIHPFQFGDPWMKETCLWLKGLPQLRDTNRVEPEGHWVKPGNKRPHRRFDHVPEGGNGNAKDRSKTFQGIAEAMADQWGTPQLYQRSPPIQQTIFTTI